MKIKSLSKLVDHFKVIAASNDSNFELNIRGEFSYCPKTIQVSQIYNF